MTSKPHANTWRRLPLVLVFALALLQMAVASAPLPAGRSVRASRVTPRSPVGGSDFAWISRLNGNGPEVSWDEATDVAFLPDGRIAAAGAIQLSSGERAFTVAVFRHDGVLDWFRTIQGTAVGWDSEGLHVAVDTLGNVVAAGKVYDALVGTGARLRGPRRPGNTRTQQEEFARPAILAVSFTGAGTERWRERISSPFGGEVEAHALSLDRVNNVLIVGAADGGESSTDFLAAKLLGSDGHIAWQRLFDGGAALPDAALGVTSVPSSNSGEQDDVIATGYFTDQEFSTHFTVMKIDGDFGDAVHWTTQVEFANEPVSGSGLDVAADAAGDVVAAGWLAPGDGTEFAVVKLAGATGDQDWLYRHPTAASFSNDQATHVALDSQNRVIAGGTVATNNSGSDHLLVKLNDATGSAVWTRQLEEFGHQRVRDLALDPHDFIVTAMETTVSESVLDFEVVRHGPDGALNWRRVYAGSAEGGDLARAVDTNLQGNIAAAGFTEEAATGSDFAVALIDCQIPTLLEPSLDPTVLPSAGGNVLAKVLALDNLGIDRVHAVVFNPDESETLVQLSQVSPGRFEDPVSIPANPDPEPKIYLIGFQATDINGNTNRLPGMQVTVAAADDTSPEIIECALGANTVPAGGGSVPIDATVVDNVAVEFVQATVFGPDSSFILSATLSPVGGDDFSAILPLPANPNPVERVFTVKLFAYDAVGNEAIVNCGTVAQEAADDEAPSIQNCVLNPTELPQTGGQVTVTAVVTDNVEVDSVTATVTPEVGSPVEVALTRNSGDNWAANFGLAANAGPTPARYAVSLKAQDTSGNSSSADCGTVAVAAPDTAPPTISTPQVTPTSLSSDGGTVTIRATVTDNGGVAQVVADVSTEQPAPKGKKGKKRVRPRPAAVIAQVPLSHVGNNVYEGQYTAPANETTQAAVYTVAVRAQDTSGNPAIAAAGDFTVAAYVPGRIQVTPSNLNFGLVDLNATAQREFTIRNIGKGPLTAEMTNLGAPFRILLKKETPTPLGKQERYFFGLAPGESLQVRVEFTPVRHARYPAEIRIFSNDAKKKVARVQIRAFGCDLRRR